MVGQHAATVAAAAAASGRHRWVNRFSIFRFVICKFLLYCFSHFRDFNCVRRLLNAFHFAHLPMTQHPANIFEIRLFFVIGSGMDFGLNKKGQKPPPTTTTTAFPKMAFVWIQHPSLRPPGRWRKAQSAICCSHCLAVVEAQTRETATESVRNWKTCVQTDGDGHRRLSISILICAMRAAQMISAFYLLLQSRSINNNNNNDLSNIGRCRQWPVASSQ